MRYFIELSYDGSNYHGWQMQPNEITVQQVLEESLTTLLRRDTKVVGCGRTDAGVHAEQFFAHFDAENALDKEKLKYQLNRVLPRDIAIFRLIEVDEELHARFSATARTYQYRIGLEKDAFNWALTWQRAGLKLDLGLMNAAAKSMVGRKDFSCFSRSGTDLKNFDCSVMEAVWRQVDKGLIFEIRADRFLRNMVRAVVGTLLEVGLGKLKLEDFEEIIASKDRKKAGASAKARGLFLTKISYPEGSFDPR